MSAVAISKSKMSIQLCANLAFMFTENPNYIDRYQLASDAGFKAVEGPCPYNVSVDELLQAKTKANVQQILLNAQVPPNVFGYAAIPGEEDSFKKSIEETVKFAKALNCPKIHVTAGTVSGPVTEAHDRTYESNLRYATGIFERENIIGVIEPINGYSLPNYYLNNFEKGLEFVKKINSPHLRLQLDLFHLQHIRGDLTNSIRNFMPYVGHVQVAQVPDRGEPDTVGEIDYKYVFSVLKKEGYAGYVGLEYKPANGTKNGLKWIANYGFSL